MNENKTHKSGEYNKEELKILETDETINSIQKRRESGKQAFDKIRQILDRTTAILSEGNQSSLVREEIDKKRASDLKKVKDMIQENRKVIEKRNQLYDFIQSRKAVKTNENTSIKIMVKTPIKTPRRTNTPFKPNTTKKDRTPLVRFQTPAHSSLQKSTANRSIYRKTVIKLDGKSIKGNLSSMKNKYLMERSELVKSPPNVIDKSSPTTEAYARIIFDSPIDLESRKESDMDMMDMLDFDGKLDHLDDTNVSERSVMIEPKQEEKPPPEIEPFLVTPPEKTPIKSDLNWENASETT